MPVNQGSGFNYVQTNPYDFDDWGGTMGGGHDGSSALSIRGTFPGSGTGNYNVKNASSNLYEAYEAGTNRGYHVVGMHQRATRWSQMKVIVPNSPMTTGQPPFPGQGCIFRWHPNGSTEWMFIAPGVTTFDQSNTPAYPGFPPSTTNPPFVIFDNQLNQGGAPHPGGYKARIMVFHSNGTMISQKKYDTALIESTARFVCYTNSLDSGTECAWDMEPIAGGSNYNFDQVTIPSP